MNSHNIPCFYKNKDYYKPSYLQSKRSSNSSLIDVLMTHQMYFWYKSIIFKQLFNKFGDLELIK
jgi:hypothetical protein